MTNLQDQLARLTPARVRGMRRGLEKESLRVLPNGDLALTPHPAGLGSPLTHPTVTTDFSESQIELVTGAHRSVDATLHQLREIHRAVFHVMGQVGDERLWPSSMPCKLPTDETIPLGRYGKSNVGRAKSVYRMGLAHRYGRRMQTISGIHYNWSLPDVSSDEYFALIRNFRRHAFLLLVLFGASPLVCKSFVAGREHQLQQMGPGCMGLPHATSLRMGRLGYQSDAQSSLKVSYNGLDGYAASLEQALTQPYGPYQAIGIQNLGGDYNQLDTSLLQIENEFYGTIRPKRVIRPGERPLHALRERGVEYVEVRLMDLDPFVPVGITAQTMRLLDVFLLHCLLTDSPPDTPTEITEIKYNQHLTAARGREPGLQLLRQRRSVALVDWAADILAQCAPLAAALDATHHSGDYSAALAQARSTLADAAQTPSARVLAQMAAQHNNSFSAFTLHQSTLARDALVALPWSAAQQARSVAEVAASLVAQKTIEDADSLPFEEWRQQYMAAQGLG